MAILITGVCGQDGSYLAEQLAAEGQALTGVIAPGQTPPDYIAALSSRGQLALEACDIGDPAAFRLLLKRLRPDKVFHLAAMSQPVLCEAQPDLSRAVNVTSVEVLREWVRHEYPSARVLVLSSAAVFGERPEVPQSEDTPAQPANEYGRQKESVRQIAAHARSDGLFLACAIPFNHESQRRPEDFVFAKICRSVARIALGQQSELRLGNLSSRRDWGYAPEYCEAFRWMLEVDQPTELIIATGEAHSVEELVTEAFACAGLDPANALASDHSLIRAADTLTSQGDPARAWKELGWEAKTKFKALVKLMVDDALRQFGG